MESPIAIHEVFAGIANAERITYNEIIAIILNLGFIIKGIILRITLYFH